MAFRTTEKPLEVEPLSKEDLLTFAFPVAGTTSMFSKIAARRLGAAAAQAGKSGILRKTGSVLKGVLQWGVPVGSPLKSYSRYAAKGGISGPIKGVAAASGVGLADYYVAKEILPQVKKTIGKTTVLPEAHKARVEKEKAYWEELQDYFYNNPDKREEFERAPKTSAEEKSAYTALTSKTPDEYISKLEKSGYYGQEKGALDYSTKLKLGQARESTGQLINSIKKFIQERR